MSRVNLISFGCPKNQVDSEKLLGLLKSEGIEYTDAPDKADAILINTCGFIDDAKRESINGILEASSIKGGRRLIVFGCLAQRYGDKLLKEVPEIDNIFGVGDEDRIVSLLKGDKKSRIRRSKRVLLNPLHYAYLKIAEGCNRGCTYCVIPSIRGPYKSRMLDEIVKEAQAIVKGGVNEVILVAQDTTSYGTDLKIKNALPSLLERISDIDGIKWIRLLYTYPTSITDELIAVIASRKNICKYMDIPIQHSEESILRQMGRRGGRQEYMRLIQRLRKAIPDIILRTSIMVGFPTEGEKEFQGLTDFIRDAEFDRLGVFTYSKEDGTPAKNMSGHVSQAIKEKRRNMIMEMQANISLKRNRSFIGKTMEVLIDEADGDYSMARTMGQAPEIDGVTFLKNADGLSVGDIVKVRITEAQEYDLIAEAVPQQVVDRKFQATSGYREKRG